MLACEAKHVNLQCSSVQQHAGLQQGLRGLPHAHNTAGLDTVCCEIDTARP